VGERYGSVGHRAHREVVSHGGDWPQYCPVQGEIDRCETSRKGPRGVWATVGGEGGKGRVEACRCQVHAGWGVYYPQRCKPLPLGHREGDWGEAGLYCKDADRCC